MAEASGPDVTLFLAAGHRGGIGPASVGHVARFTIDHARGPVIVVRLTSYPENDSDEGTASLADLLDDRSCSSITYVRARE